MRRKRRVDSNQSAIVAALRAAGCSVEVLSDVGRGVPDLLAGFEGQNFLLEVKRPGEELNKDQAHWFRWWGGQTAVVHSAEDALTVVLGCHVGIEPYHLGAKARRA